MPAGGYTIDPHHSNVGFEVRHMGIATIRGGAFKTFEGTMDATGETTVLGGAVAVASFDTGEPNRDGHLASPEFFDADRHPQITFHTTAIEAADDRRIRLAGEITMKRITKPIELTGTLGQGGTAPCGRSASASRSRGRSTGVTSI